MSDQLSAVSGQLPVRCGCGGEAYARSYANTFHVTEDGYDHTVYCSKCNIETKMFDTEAEAITAWNRAMGERTAKVEAVEKPIIGDTEGKTIKVTSCGNCKNTVSIFDDFCSNCGCRLIWGDDDE